MRSKGETGPGEDSRVSARGELASWARTIRGGRSGPSAANGSTLGTTAENTVGVKTGAGTASTELKIAPREQHEAQALHLCLLASLTLAEATETAETAETADSSSDSSSTSAAAWGCSCPCAAAPS
jgi:hypothetical protein